MTTRTPLDRLSNLAPAWRALVGLSAALGACTLTEQRDRDGERSQTITASVIRSPIHEADRSIVVFVGHARGGLSASQRADVMGLAQTWVREGTGAIVADVPVDTPNARAAAASFREIRSVLDGWRRARRAPSRCASLPSGRSANASRRSG